MVEVGIHSIKKWDVVKEIVLVFWNVLFFVGCPTTEYVPGVIVADQISVQYGVFFARRRTRTPGKNKTIAAILQFYLQSHSEYYAPLRTFLLYSVPFRFRPSLLLYLPCGPGKLSSATVKQRDQANPINQEHLFFMIVDNLVVL